MKYQALKMAFLILVLSCESYVIEASKKKSKKTKLKITPVLKADAKVLALIKKLKPGQSVLLPPVKTTGDINAIMKKFQLDKYGTGSRDWCIKMVLMPNRKRAWYNGGNQRNP